jgi:Zn-dependent alcohol dehydrogenase
VIAVDPVEFKREKAMEFGATHTAASMAEALPMVNDLTMGQLADRVIMTPGVLYGDLIIEGMALTGKGGTCVATGRGPHDPGGREDEPLRAHHVAEGAQGRHLRGAQPPRDIPELLSMYRAGQLKLDELITKTYTLDEINEGYQDMRDNKNVRGMIVFD